MGTHITVDPVTRIEGHLRIDAEVDGGVVREDWSSGQMAADVQSWLDTPSQNYGWTVIGNETQIQTTKRFGTRENTGSTGGVTGVTGVTGGTGGVTGGVQCLNLFT